MRNGLNELFGYPFGAVSVVVGILGRPEARASAP